MMMRFDEMVMITMMASLVMMKIMMKMIMDRVGRLCDLRNRHYKIERICDAIYPYPYRRRMPDEELCEWLKRWIVNDITGHLFGEHPSGNYEDLNAFMEPYDDMNEWQFRQLLMSACPYLSTEERQDTALSLFKGKLWGRGSELYDKVFNRVKEQAVIAIELAEMVRQAGVKCPNRLKPVQIVAAPAA